ncbi:helix-turn-helix transcriptional regulator [Roseibium aggregatum]|uniref:Helix-turn-helix transcriptional regulator n=1 Tax=Roseibium aggregatum TaxID=187304 RepID=A0A926P0G0_9HYPH|nr:helix-turn-helix transcriptional regulator [Roseibium aggregatum]MBD1547666.1 helix-turn-helix transcriptional regulator [Roseibium aggregatum]
MAEEFRLLENVHACANDPDSWHQTLVQIEKSCRWRIHLLELTSDGRHTGRYCDHADAADLIDYLSSISAHAGQNSFQFLLHEARAFFPYNRESLDRGKFKSYYGTGTKIHEFGIYPGYITLLNRNNGRIILLCCLFVSEKDDEATCRQMLQTFVRLSKAISLTLDLTYRFEYENRRQLALHALVQNRSQSSFLIGTDFSIKISTPACEKLLSDGDVFATEEDRLVPLRKDVESALQIVCSDIDGRMNADRPADVGLSATPPAEQSLLLSRADDRLARVLVRSILPESMPLQDRSDAFILVEVRNQLELPEDVSGLLKSCFDLSEKEAHLAYILTTSGSLTATLELLGITRNTAKTHLRRIYEKTATQSQLELFKLLHGLSGLL